MKKPILKTVLLTLSHLLVAVLAAVLALQLTPAAEPSKLDRLESLVVERFIGGADKTAIEDAAADAMVNALGDRWSYYIPASEYAAYLEQMQNAYVGVGITIQADPEGRGYLVLDVVEGGPAEAAGILADDILIGVEGTSVADITLEFFKCKSKW